MVMSMIQHMILYVKQEANHKVGLGETPHRLIRKLEKSENAFDAALNLMQTKPSDAAFSAIFRTSINADKKQLEMSYLVRLYTNWARISQQALVIIGQSGRIIRLFVTLDTFCALLCII